VHVTEQDARDAYAQWLAELAATTVDLRILVLPIASGSSATAIAARRALGEEIVDRARTRRRGSASNGSRSFAATSTSTRAFERP